MGNQIYRARKQAQAEHSDLEAGVAVPPEDVPLEDILRSRSQTARASAGSWPQTVESGDAPSSKSGGPRVSPLRRFASKMKSLFKKEEDW